jgi:large-conductance mechanosensitive channel
MVKIITRLKDQLVKEQADGEIAPAPLTKDQELLTEIKDLLSEKKVVS